MIAPVGGMSAPQAPQGPTAAERRAAEGFERVLLTQLTKTMTEGLTKSGPYANVLPEALADAVAEAGGLGLWPR